MATVGYGVAAADVGNTTVRLSEVVAALSYALDITEGQPEGHAARTCLIGMRLADELGLPTSDRSALFYALLLKDLGCSSNAAKMCYLFGADDRVVKRGVKTIDWPKMSQSVRFLMRNVGPDRSPLERLLKAAALAIQGPSGAKKLVETRCNRGADISTRLGFPPATAQAILDLDEHWNGKGHPYGRRGEEISLLGRIAGLAQTVEVFHTQRGAVAAWDMARARRGKWFDPQLVDLLMAVRTDEDFWQRLRMANLEQEVAACEPADQVRLADEALLDQLAEAFARVVDAKSPWTFLHSSGVAEISEGIATVLGYDPLSLRRVRQMGLLHDIGKLGVSNMILDKPGRLDDDEMVVLRRHPEHTHRILSRVGGFREFSDLAAAHHERIDGRGYHLGLAAGELPLPARILTVADIFEALSAARPYRPAVPQEQVLEIMRRDANVAICPMAFSALRTWLERKDYSGRVEAQLAEVERLLAEF
jgi:putative nucleotidyltransferase with HDIG domain